MSQPMPADRVTYNIPAIDYANPNIKDLGKLEKFLKSSGLMPKTKLRREGSNFGKWTLMIKAIDDERDGYVLSYWWSDRFDEYSDDYLVFLEDGVGNGGEYRFERNREALAELDRIVRAFGKSKEWSND